jgi:hypothetical protein
MIIKDLLDLIRARAAMISPGTNEIDESAILRDCLSSQLTVNIS